MEVSFTNYFTLDIKISTFYIIGYLYYYWSLARINPKRIRCLKGTDFKCFFMIAEFVLISSFIINIVIYIILFFKLKKFHLFNIFVIYIFLYFIDHDNGLVNHGIYNFLIFIFLSFFSFIIFCYTKFLCFLSKRLKYRNILFAIFFFFLFFLYFYSSKYEILIIIHV
jgi:hypothetical protein